ncbi:MAG TPA: 16S rRNA (uracil(1498)-N(3))-methyltransferase [Steroidobacteraceae bacterium]|nr:16S rRNA (uracil(1498)-N(3))-methyltransferase [Steroidobacteraceae bacterium]
MRLTRCFVPAALAAGSVVALPEAAALHVTRVLRLRAGAALTLFDGRGGEFPARLLEPDAPPDGRSGGRATVQVEVGEHCAVEREAPLAVTLLQCLARGERMDWIVQKATELGVAAIVPLTSRYSVVQLDAAAAARRRAHWQGIATGACEQCGRNRVPEVAPLREVEPACAVAAASQPPALRLLLSAQAALTLPRALQRSSGPPRAAPVTLLVGPEGGLAEPELLAAQAHGFLPCSLGPRILRSETAPIAALAAIQAVMGDFQ